MYQVVLTGPESTGKSTLAKALAELYKTEWIGEYARWYISQLDRPYQEFDLLKIAQQQQGLIATATTGNQPFLFIDTAMLVVKVWSIYKYGRCHPWILQQLTDNSIDLYVLCGIDVPWESDPQREHPQQRQELYAIYKKQLQKHQLPYIEVSGTHQERLDIIKEELLKRFGCLKK